MGSASRVSERAPVLLLALAVAIAAALLLGLNSNLTFIADDWDLLFARQGHSPGVFLEPFNENIVLAVMLLNKLLIAVFGLGSAFPYYCLSIGLFLTSAVLLFVYLRRRVGDWLALLGAVSILFMGAAFESTLWTIQAVFFGGMAAGLGMLLALRRGDRRGDRVACALLATSLAFSSLGLAFAAGALADVLSGRRPRAGRAFVPLLPLAVFALWWLVWGRTAESHLSLENAIGLPEYLFTAAAAGITSLLGLATGDGTSPDQPHLIWGKLVLLTALALGTVRVARTGISRDLLVVLAVGLAFWGLAGLMYSPELRFPTSSRYQYASGIFLLLIAAETWRGARVPSPAVIAVAALTGFAVWGGIALLLREYDERWRPAADSIRATLAAVEIAGPSADPGFQISFPPSVVLGAGGYLAVSGARGSPAFSEAELAARPQWEREGADGTLAQALGLQLRVPPDPGLRRVGCQALRASAAGYTGVTLLRGGFTLTNLGAAEVGLRLGRFAEGFAADLGTIGPGATASLSIPPDRSALPWNLGLTGDGPVRLCTTAVAI